MNASEDDMETMQNELDMQNDLIKLSTEIGSILQNNPLKNSNRHEIGRKIGSLKKQYENMKNNSFLRRRSFTKRLAIKLRDNQSSKISAKQLHRFYRFSVSVDEKDVRDDVAFNRYILAMEYKNSNVSLAEIKKSSD